MPDSVLLEPPDQNERFRARRRQARRRRSIRRVAVLAVVALLAAAVALGAVVLGGGKDSGRRRRGAGRRTARKRPRRKPKPEPRPLPAEIRGVHVTMALASLNGKLDEYFALARPGNDGARARRQGRERRGRVQPPERARSRGHRRGAGLLLPAGRRAPGAGARPVRRSAESSSSRTRVLARERPAPRDPAPGRQRLDDVTRARLDEPVRPGVWKYNVDIAEAAVKAGFDEIMFDYVRFPTDGDVASAVYSGRVREPKAGDDQPLPRVRAVAAQAAGRARLRRRLRPERDTRDGDRPAATPARQAPRRDLPDGLPLPLRAGRVQPRRPERGPRDHRRRSLADFRRALRGQDTLARPLAPGLLARPRVHRRRRPGADSGRPRPEREGLPALERRRPCTRGARSPGARPPHPQDCPQAGPGSVDKLWKTKLFANCTFHVERELALPAQAL